MVLTTNSFSEAFSVFDAYGLINIKHSFLQVTPFCVVIVVFWVVRVVF